MLLILLFGGWVCYGVWSYSGLCISYTGLDVSLTCLGLLGVLLIRLGCSVFMGEGVCAVLPSVECPYRIRWVHRGSVCWFWLVCFVLSCSLSSSLSVYLSIYFIIIFESVDLRSFFRPILSIRRSTLTLKFSLFVYHLLVSSISIKVVSFST